jgi:hypothetical protein
MGMLFMQADYQNCILCGNENLSHEHVIPKWMYSNFPQLFSEPLYTAMILPGGVIDESLPGKNGIKIPVLCESCNRVFGSQIQKRAKPFLTDMILNGKVSLTKKQCKHVSKWCFNYLVVREFYHPMVKALSDETRGNFLRNIIPHGILMFVKSHINSEPPYSRLRVFQHSSSDKLLFLVLQIGKVSFLILADSSTKYLTRYSLARLDLQMHLQSLGFTLFFDEKSYPFDIEPLQGNIFSRDDASHLIDNLSNILMRMG